MTNLHFSHLVHLQLAPFHMAVFSCLSCPALALTPPLRLPLPFLAPYPTARGNPSLQPGLCSPIPASGILKAPRKTRPDPSAAVSFALCQGLLVSSASCLGWIYLSVSLYSSFHLSGCLADEQGSWPSCVSQQLPWDLQQGLGEELWPCSIFSPRPLTLRAALHGPFWVLKPLR